MNKSIDKLMQREMTRRKFLLSMILLLGSILGFSKIIELLTGHSLDKNISINSTPKLEYGGGNYGGSAEGSKITVSASPNRRIS